MRCKSELRDINWDVNSQSQYWEEKSGMWDIK